jgi:hypothetical protein
MISTGTKPPEQISVGAKVRLRGCAFGEPGTVLRIERRKVAVYWQDLDFLSRHSPDSLMLVAGPGKTDTVTREGER